MNTENWRKYPIVLIGYDIRRWENGDEQYAAYFNRYREKFLLWEKQDHWGPTHIQYHSPWGFLLTWPLCFHVWYQFKPQEQDKPGTEKVFYFRIGAARWDAGDNKYITWKIGLGTWFLGLHWD